MLFGELLVKEALTAPGAWERREPVGGRREGGSLTPDHQAEPHGRAEPQRHAQAGGRAEAGGRWRGAGGMHQRASDIMVWVFLSRMKCNLQTTSLATRKLRGSAARSRTGPPRTRGRLPGELRAGPGLYFFFPPFGSEKRHFSS